MGIRQAYINMDTNKLPQPPEITDEPGSSVQQEWNERRNKRFQMTHPSVTYKVVKLLRENLKLSDTPVVEGEIAWDPCENQEKKWVTGTVKYKMGYMLAAAILGDREKLQQGYEKRYPMIPSPEERFNGIVQKEEPVYVKCIMRTDDSVSYDMVEIHEHSLWGMLLWPVWEKESDFHRFLWEMIGEEYRSADQIVQWDMQKVILDSIDSLYILKYQEKAMKICERVLPNLCRGAFSDFDDPTEKIGGIVIGEPVMNEHFLDEDSSADGNAVCQRLCDMEWEMSLMESWSKMYIFIKYEIFRYLSNDRPDDFVHGMDRIRSLAGIYMIHWRRAIEDAGRSGRVVREQQDSYLEKKWKTKNIFIKAWKNKIWPEDEVSRQLEKLELEEYDNGRYGEKIKLRFILSMRLLEKLMNSREGKKSRIKYVYFMNALWDELETDSLSAECYIEEIVLEKELEKAFISEVKKSLIKLSKNYPEAKEILASTSMAGKSGPIQMDKAELEHCLQKLLFCKNQMFPEESELRMNIHSMVCFETLRHPKPYTEESGKHTTFDLFGDPMETDGESMVPAGEFEERNILIRKIWKLLNFYGFMDNYLTYYQGKILEFCNESDFLYARSCGLFPDNILNEAKLYAVEKGNLKVLPALICLTAQKKDSSY